MGGKHYPSVYTVYIMFILFLGHFFWNQSSNHPFLPLSWRALVEPTAYVCRPQPVRIFVNFRPVPSDIVARHACLSRRFGKIIMSKNYRKSSYQNGANSFTSARFFGRDIFAIIQPIANASIRVDNTDCTITANTAL